MLHRISDLCKKIDGIKAVSDRLYNLKYNTFYLFSALVSRFFIDSVLFR